MVTVILRKSEYAGLVRHLLKKRYLRKGKNGEVVETSNQMFRRVSDAIARVEEAYKASEPEVRKFSDQFLELMTIGVFIPNTPTLMNAGRPRGMLSACFVLLIEDSLDSIFDTVKNTALIQKAGGGTGFSFDRLRPTGDQVRSSGGKTSGPLSFGRILSETTQAIQQGAFRRGANMGMMSVEHPDCLRFIHAKGDTKAFTNFNFSIKVSDAFMKQMEDDPNTLHVVINPRTKKRYLIPRSVNIDTYTIDDLTPEGQQSTDCYSVREVWDMVVRNAHATGEPGVCFIGRVNGANPTPHLGRIEATNPCGEQPLLPFESCNLGSINLCKFIRKDRTDLCWDSLTKAVALAVRFLDNVVDENCYPVPEIEEATLGNRKIGLGVMGFADMLILLGIRYDSDEAVKWARKVARFIQEHAHQASENLARKRGCFPKWKGSVWDTEHHRPMRNASVTTIAPTGSISIIAGCNGGIEPVFKLVQERKVLDGQEFAYLSPAVERPGMQEGWLSEKVCHLLMQGIQPGEIPDVPKDRAEVMVTAHEVSPEWHVRIQAAFQEHTDNAVSKTVNLPSSATLEDVDYVFRLAYDLGCKGTTVFRDGSRESFDQVIVASRGIDQSNTPTLSPRVRIRRTEGQTTKFRIGCGTLFVTVNRDDQGICEVFANLGKAGGCPSQSEGMCRTISTGLRCGVCPEAMIEQLKGIRCLSTIAAQKADKDIDVLSCPDAIARALYDALQESPSSAAIPRKNRCPDCGRPLRREEGCNICDSCGFSRCG